jgi:phosphate-selective porin OprO/OprP
MSHDGFVMARSRAACSVVCALVIVGVASPAAAQVRTSLLKLDFHVKSQMDLRDFPSEPGTDSKDLFDLHRARVGIDGTMLKRFDYQIERELHDTTQPWRDVYLDARVVRALEVRAGQFKIPFGLDQLTGSMDLDFNYRSLAGTYLAPGRDVGVMLHGRLINDIVRYQAGVFRQGGDNIRSSERSDPQTDRTFAGRVVVRPWSGAKAHKMLRTLSAGMAFTSGELPEGPNSLRGKTVPGDAFFDHLYVNGRRARVGAEFQWRPASFGLQGEIMRARDQRFGQGIDNENLPDVMADGWYVSGTWLATGERKKDSVEPERPFLTRGIGAVEFAGRVEQLHSSSVGGVPTVFVSPRSAWIAPRTDTVWTAGVNWYLNNYFKLQANIIREQRLLNGGAIPGQQDFWSRTLRLQFGF